MKIIIAEKPKVAKKIVEAIFDKYSVKKMGKAIYYEAELNGEKYLVLPAVGHLYSLFPKTKGWDYPIFEVEWRPRGEIKGQEYSLDYLKVMKRFVPKAEEIIIATDYDVEGSVIGHNIASFLNPAAEIKRMKFSSLTKEELRKAFEEAHTPTEFEMGMYEAGITRHVLDWFWGINLSRALMHSIKRVGKFRVLSTGRVQGPTLKLVVDREREIRGFKVKFKYRIDGFSGRIKFEGPVFEDKDLKKAVETFKSLEFVGRVVRVVRKVQKVDPPPPFNLTDLQSEASRVFGIDPKTTLDIAQQLYEAGVISYPRTSSQKLPKDLNTAKILEGLRKVFKFPREWIGRKPVEGEKEDPAHPAIYPTGVLPKNITAGAAKIYELIARRFIAAFATPAVIERKKFEVNVSNVLFSVSDSCIVERGWLEIYPYYSVECRGIELKEGEEVVFDYFDLVKIPKRPPKRYTAMALIKEMEKLGIGTKATRAEIVKVLYDRGYIEGKRIMPTPLAEAVIEALERYVPEIVDVSLTRRFEREMEEILFRKKGSTEVIDAAKRELTKILKKFKEVEEEVGKTLVKNVDTYFGGFCPYCGGRVIVRIWKNSIEYVCEKCKRVWREKGRNFKLEPKFCEKCSLRLASKKVGRKKVTFCPEHGVVS